VKPAALPRTVVALGWVSLLTDAASDMIYPLIPAFLLTLGGGAVAIGWLEGVAEAVGAVLKLFSGAVSDRAARRKPLIALGYGVSALTRPLLALATSPLHAVLVRAIDRVGKGLRGPPRDAMVADATPPAIRGHAFGFHRMMDNSGAVVGSLLAFAFLRWLELDLRTVFKLAVIPALLAVAVIFVFVREPPRAEAAPAKPRPTLSGGPPFGPAARRYFAAIAVFSLAGSGDMFLIYRLLDLGLPRALVPVVWMTLQLGKALLNVPGGKAADRYGRRPLLVIAWALYAVSYAALGFAPGWIWAWAVLGLYALHYGLAEGGQRALLAECVEPAAFGRAYGTLLAIEGAMVLPANVLFGLAYAKLGAGVAFAAAGALALAGAGVLATVRPVRD
jgi:MFS family permease